MNFEDIKTLLAKDASSLLNHVCEKIPKAMIQIPSGTHVQDTFVHSNRSKTVLNSLNDVYGHGTLANTGYLSIFPVDQGMEHTAAFSFAENPIFFDPDNIVNLALQGGCSAVASTYGVLALLSKKYAEQIPFIVKINHSEHLTNPEKIDQLMFTSVQQSYQLGAKGIGATIYFGSEESHQQIEEIAQAFEIAHSLGMFTILWCYPRNSHYKKNGTDYESAVDITAQANHIGVTLGADIIKQKLPNNLHGFQDLEFSKYSNTMYDNLLTDNPIDLVRYQVAHCYMGKISLINSGGESGDSDLQDAIKTAVINKRGGGSGLIMGRKVFKKPWHEALEMLEAVQSVYACEEITVA